jgi:hypothetical protein
VTTENIIDFENGAYREYEVELSDQSKVSLAFIMGRLEDDTRAARFARRQNALAFGLLSIVGVSDAPGRPLLWMVDAEGLALAKEEHDIQISGELQKLTELYLRLFLIQVRPIAPHWASMEWSLDPAVNDNHAVH